MNVLKCKLEIEVSDYKFPISIYEVSNKPGEFVIEEHTQLTEEEISDNRVKDIILKLEELDASETRDVLSWLYDNKQCEFDEVLRDEDAYGLHINSHESRSTIVENIYQYVSNDTDLYEGLFEEYLSNCSEGEDLIERSVNNHNKRNAFSLALKILNYINDNYGI